MADDRAARHDGDPSVSTIRGANVPRVHVLLDDVPGLQHVPDSDVHSVRVQDTQDPGGLQRGQIHRLHYVLDVHRLAGFRAHLLRHQQRLQGLCDGIARRCANANHILTRPTRRASRRVFLC